MPLAAAGIEAALRTRTTSGSFSGRIEYRGASGDPEVRVSGRLQDLLLREVTAALPFGPINGLLDVAIDRAVIRQGLVTHLTGRGRARDVLAADFAPLLGRDTLAGRAELNIRTIDAALGHLHQLVIDGRLEGVSLGELTSLLGRGSATGTLHVTINAMRVVDDRIDWADVQIEAIPPESHEAGTIDRELLLGAAQEVLDFTWPESIPKQVLPEKIEYARFGVRLIVSRNRLRVAGTHGRDNDTILTIRLFGRAIPVIHSLRREIDLTPYLEQLGERIRSSDPREIRDWWRERRAHE